MHRHLGGEFVSAAGVLPGAVVSAVGYDSCDLVPQLHRGLPSPYLTFIFSLGGPIVSGMTPQEAQGPAAARNEVLVAGLHDAPTFVVQPESQAGIQLAVHPLAARGVFGAPASRVPWQVTEGADLLGAEADEVRERLHCATTWEGRFTIVADYLRRRMAQQRHSGGKGRPELAEAWRWLAARGGTGSIEELARHVGLSGRRLRALFTAELGVSPKRLAALTRFDRTRQRLASATVNREQLRLTQLAVDGGYYDHSHLVGDFHRFAGLSPSAWLVEERRNIQAGGHQTGADSGP